MNIDDIALENYKGILKRDFNEVIIATNNIEDSFKKITNCNNWDSETRDYFYNKCKVLIEDFEIVNDQFTNIINYMDSKINDVRNLDSSIVKNMF